MSSPNLVGMYRDGLFRRKIVTISSASTGYTLRPEESGTLFYLNAGTTIQVRLPLVSSKRLGVNYEFFLPGGSSGVDIVTNINSSVRIVGVGTSGSTASRVQAAGLRSTEFDAGCRLTAVSSVLWLFEEHADPGLVIISSAASSVRTGTWAAGTTST